MQIRVTVKALLKLGWSRTRRPGGGANTVPTSQLAYLYDVLLFILYWGILTRHVMEEDVLKDLKRHGKSYKPASV